LQKFIPVGLNVYCFGPEIRGLFEAEGFRMVRISEGLFRVNTNVSNKQAAPCN
jgi:hypothetical protein